MAQVDRAKLKLDFWFLLSNEERSWVILKCYSDNILKKHEVEPLLRKDRLNNWFSNILPLAIFPALNIGLERFALSLKYGNARGRRALAAFLIGVPIFTAWRRYNPFRTDLVAERERLLHLINRRVGHTNLLNSNELLPRWMTEFEVHRRLRVLIRQREGILSGIVYPTQDQAEPILAFDPFTKQTGEHMRL